MRFKQWESPKDLDNEQAAARVIERAWDCNLHKMPKQYRLDFVATRQRTVTGKDNAVAFIEFKRRHRTLLKWPTIILSLSKIIHARELTETTGLPCFFLVQFDDCLAYSKLQPGYPITFGGRTVKTRDRRDFEPVVNIPTKDMEIIPDA